MQTFILLTFPFLERRIMLIIEPRHDKTNKIECASTEGSDQPGHPPSLIRVFAVRMKKHWVLIYPLSAQRGLWSDWADVQTDLSLRWSHTHFVGFVMSRLILWPHLKILWHYETVIGVIRRGRQKKRWSIISQNGQELGFGDSRRGS